MICFTRVGCLALAFVVGCAGQGDIDRTQPDKVPKSMFFHQDGTPKIFYYRSTVIAVPPTSGVSAEGRFGPLEKVRFEIRQDELVAFRAYDYAPGSQNDFTSGDNNKDTPIVSFAIVSHFDVKREYNPATGEQSNVIAENTTDRPWYEREYMRIDWSEGLDQHVREGDITSPYRPIVTPDYLDVVGVQRMSVDRRTCFYQFNDIWDDGSRNCGDADVVLRRSFLPVKPSTYEPLEYPDRVPLLDEAGKPLRAYRGRVFGNTTGDYACTPEFLENAARYGVTESDCFDASAPLFEKFGYFRVVRQEYDRKAGVTVYNRKYFAKRWNIWDRSREEDGKPIPVKDRTIKPIVYHQNVEWPEDDPMITEAAAETVAGWNLAFQRTVAGMMLTEASNGEPVTLEATDEKVKELPDVVVLRPNSCTVATVKKHVADHEDQRTLAEEVIGGSIDHLSRAKLVQVCSALEATTENLPRGDLRKFEWQRNGDLRYSFVYWVDRPQYSGPLGYGPSSADPETGEIISAALYEYGAALDRRAQWAVDVIALVNSEISVDSLVSGRTIADLIDQNRADRARREAVDVTPEAQDAVLGALGEPGDRNRLVKMAPDAIADRLEKLRGSDLEKELLTSDVLAAFLPGYQPGMELDDDMKEMASLANLFSPRMQEWHEKHERDLAMDGCQFSADLADDAILGLALELKDLPSAELFRIIRKRILRGLIEHEMGHTLGLRHNFSGSSDSLNYSDRYWDIKLNMDSADWHKEKLAEYQYSSTMDYGGHFNTDFHGLGKYDYAAIRFGYGQLVDVMPPDSRYTGNDLYWMTYWNGTKYLPGLVYKDDDAKAAEIMKGTQVAPYSKIVDDLKAQYMALGISEQGDVNTLERPYLFCSDEYVGGMRCKRWDLGASQEEIVNHAIDQYKNYYFFNAMRRGRLGWSAASYFRRLRDRYFATFSEAFHSLYFYGLSVASGYGTKGDLPLPLYNDLLKASTTALNTLGEILAQPEPGRYCTLPDSPTLLVSPYKYYGDCVNQDQAITIEFGDGKPFWSEFSDGYYYQMTRAGSFYEKLAALYALTNTRAVLRMRVDDDADPDVYSINYYRVFREPMIRLLGGLVREDAQAFGGVSLDGRYQSVPVVDLSTYGKPEAIAKPAYLGATRVQAPLYRTLRRYAALLSFAYLDSRWDSNLDFSTYLTVSLKGSDDDIIYGDSGTIVEVTHPVSQQVYRAVQTKGDAPSIAADMVLAARHLIGEPGVTGTLDSEKYGVQYSALEFTEYNAQPYPDWHTAKALLDAARLGGDLHEFKHKEKLFKNVDKLVGALMDQLNDVRQFRRMFDRQ